MTEVQGEQVIQALAALQTSADRTLFALECLIVFAGVQVVFLVVGATVRWRESK